MLIVFIVAFLLNMYIIIFGSKGIKDLFKEDVSIKKYASEILSMIEREIGKETMIFIKRIVFLLLILFLILNTFLFIKLILAFIAGTFIAKKLYEVPFVSNYINKVIIYIIRFFK